MNTLCVYYSRSGITKAMAEEITKGAGTELLELSDGNDYKGFFGYIKGAVVGLKKTLPKLLSYKTALPIEQYDRIIIVSPIWCEKPCPIVRAFVNENQNKFSGEVYYVLSHMSNIAYTDKIEGKCTANISIQTKGNDWRKELEGYIYSLR